MINKLNKRRRKKGFTLIELVIVLAVLAIIALIAIPNFTKVRNDSLEKADIQTAEQIKEITLMAIADGDIKIPLANGAGDVVQSAKIGDGGKVETVDLEFEANNGETDYEEMLKEVKKPQVNGEDVFIVKVNNKGEVNVFYEGGTQPLNK